MWNLALEAPGVLSYLDPITVGADAGVSCKPTATAPGTSTKNYESKLDGCQPWIAVRTAVPPSGSAAQPRLEGKADVPVQYDDIISVQVGRGHAARDIGSDDEVPVEVTSESHPDSLSWHRA